MPSPNMNLPVPVPTVTPGAQYAFDEVSCFNVIDSHNHTSGQGVQIPTAGLNINANLPMNNYALLNTQLVNLEAQASISTAGSLFRISDDLYYRDGSGNNVRITQSGSVAVSGAIGFTGLPSGTASAVYNSLSQSFIFESATSTPANVDCASVIVRPLTSSPQGITISAPIPLVASYSLELPAALPAATSFAAISAAGLISATIPTSLGIDTANIANNAITDVKIASSAVTTSKINNGAVDSTKIATNGVATSNIADSAVTNIKVAPFPYLSLPVLSVGPVLLTSFSFTTITSGTVTVTEANRRLMIVCQNYSNTSGFTNSGDQQEVRILITSPTYGTTYQGFQSINQPYNFTTSYNPRFNNIIELPGAETYTISIQWRVVIQNLIVTATDLGFFFQIIP